MTRTLYQFDGNDSRVGFPGAGYLAAQWDGTDKARGEIAEIFGARLSDHFLASMASRNALQVELVTGAILRLLKNEWALADGRVVSDRFFRKHFTKAAVQPFGDPPPAPPPDPIEIEMESLAADTSAIGGEGEP
jgi:hypothetical protein